MDRKASPKEQLHRWWRRLGPRGQVGLAGLVFGILRFLYELLVKRST